MTTLTPSDKERIGLERLARIFHSPAARRSNRVEENGLRQNGSYIVRSEVNRRKSFSFFDVRRNTVGV
jgi:hypothetical protein